MSLIYEAVNLKKYYGQSIVLDLPEFRLEKGATLILMGANGSGKSTFLRLLAFLENISSGTLRFFGGENPRRECTLLLQEPWLMRASVFVNVILGLRLRGIKTNLHEKFANAMQATGFQHPEIFERRRPNALSGGEKQRIALAARLVLDPSVLLLDEPTAHVDAESGNHIANALSRAHEQGITIVCATHDETLCKKLPGKIMKMRKPF